MTLLAASGPSAYWYVTRGSGVVALLLLTAAMLAGVASSTRWSAPRWPRFLVSGAHRNLTLVAIAFVAVHVVTTVADGFAPIRLVDAIVPFLSPYRPLWLGLGAVAFDLLLALVATSVLRARIGVRVWRGVHWLAYVSWPVALLHALGTGSDARTGWVELLAFACVGSVALAIAWRAAAARGPGAMRGATVAGAVAASLLLVAWYRGGPLRHGWAARAGTPTALLPAATVAPAPHADAVAQTKPVRFSGHFRGTLMQSGPDGNGLISIVIRGAARDADARLHLALRGMPLDDGGVEMTASAVGFARGAQAYTGRIDALQGNVVGVALRDAAGRSLDLVLRLDIDPATGHVTGLLRGRPAGGSE